MTAINLDSYTPFMGAICAEPLSPTPRLVLADWLEEEGDHTSADALRSWVVTWPSLFDAWQRGLRGHDIDRIPQRERSVGILSAVMAHRLTRAQWPILWGRITAWPDGWDAVRARRTIDESLVLIELATLGVLPATAAAAAQAELQGMYRMACVACDRAWQGSGARLTRAVEYATYSALSAVESAQSPESQESHVVRATMWAAYAASLAGDIATEEKSERALRRAAAALYRSSHWQRIINHVLVGVAC